MPKASSEATTVTKNSGWKVSAAEIEGGEFAAARAARDERKLARKADVKARALEHMPEPAGTVDGKRKKRKLRD